jgi:hypothetical protein
MPAGMVLHEVGHALGLIHEHSRRGRDGYVTVRWENVDPRAVSNFQRKGSRLDLDELTYNNASTMHYSAMAFSMNRHITIHRTQPLTSASLDGAAQESDRGRPPSREAVVPGRSGS